MFRRLPVALRAGLLVTAAAAALASTGTGTAYFSDTTTNAVNRVTMAVPGTGAMFWAGSGSGAQAQTVDVSRWSMAQEGLGLTTWSKVTTGGRHTCAVTTDGKLYCWGGNAYGQLGLGDTTNRSTPTQVGSGTNWATVRAGRFHTCALTTGGALSCWGANSNGQLGNNTTSSGATSTAQTVADPNAGTWSKIDLGMASTCAINSTGKLYCWGLNSQGQLGVASVVDKYVPTQVGVATTWTAISAGAQHTCGLQGTAMTCWGLGFMYALGTNATTQKTSPGTALGGTWKDVAAGRDHTCAINTAGNVQCVGAGYYGQGGTGTLANLKVLTTVGAATNWTAVAAGSMSTCALAGTALSCWGGGQSGELGLGTAEFQPAPVSMAGSWSSLSLGYDHLCAINSTGALSCAGSDGYGQLGRGATSGASSSTVTTVGTKSYTTVATSGSTTCGVGTDTKLWCWGSNGSGQLGNGTTTNSASPVQAGAATGWQSVSVGGAHACAIKSDNTLWCWGRNAKGQLGLTDTANRNTPSQVTVAGVTGWKSVSAGTMHTCAITNTNLLYCFGANNWGQLGVGDLTDHLVPVKVPTSSKIPATWKQVAAGSNFSCGLGIAGEALCWGEGVYGQYGNPDPGPLDLPKDSGSNNPHLTISVGVANACVDDTNNTNAGMLYCWGAGQWGQQARVAPGWVNATTLNLVGTGWSRPSLAGESVCATSMSTGVLHCWGDNSYGQLGLGDTTDRTTITAVTLPGAADPASLTLGSRTAFLLKSAGSYSGAVLASSPASYWRLDETSGTTVAAKAGVITGTYAGSPTGLGAAGLISDGNKAFTLDGVDDAARFGDNYDFAGTTAMSVEFWVKWTALQNNVWQRPIAKDRYGSATDRGGWAVVIDAANGVGPGSITFSRLQGAASTDVGTRITTAGTWYHVVATYDGTTQRIYLNGALEDSKPSALSLENNALPLSVGAASGSDYLGGTLDEVAVYNRALSAAEIAVHYAAAFEQ